MATPAHALDRIASAPPGAHTKYLNFGRERSGLIVTPAAGTSIANGIQFTTANDAETRDPVLVAIYGTNDPITSPDNGFGNNENWTLIVDNLVYDAPLARYTPGPITMFGNETPWTSYKIVVLENRGPDAPTAPGNGNSIQFAEVQLFSGVPEPSTMGLALAAIFGLAMRLRRRA